MYKQEGCILDQSGHVLLKIENDIKPELDDIQKKLDKVERMLIALLENESEKVDIKDAHEVRIVDYGCFVHDSD